MINMISVLTYLFMGLLVLLSVYSWTIILALMMDLRQYNKSIAQDKNFVLKLQEHRWEGVDQYFSSIHSHRVLKKLYQFFVHLAQKQTEMKQVKEKLVEKTYLWTLSLESEKAQRVTKLATIASVSPYIGLLGTVLGIMQAFISMGQASSAMAISQLAPGLAEALVATALGLFVAIPAQAAHYYFQSHFQNSHNLLLENSLSFIDNVEFVTH